MSKRHPLNPLSYLWLDARLRFATTCPLWSILFSSGNVWTAMGSNASIPQSGLALNLHKELTASR